jgi:hypothetical protein
MMRELLHKEQGMPQIEWALLGVVPSGAQS